MAKKSAENSGASKKKPNEKDVLTTEQMKEWSKELKRMVRQLDNYSRGLEDAGITEFSVIWKGFDSSVKRAKYLMRNQIQRQVKNNLEQAGFDAVAEDLE